MMKKMIALLFVLFWICTYSPPAWAQEVTDATAMERYHSWGRNLPEYICGAGKKERLKLVDDASTVSFVYQIHSRKDLYQIFQEMHGYFQKSAGLISLGVSDTGNCVKVEIYDRYRNDPDTQDMIREMVEKYGDAVNIEFIDEAHLPVPQPATVPVPRPEPTPSPELSVDWLMWTVPLLLTLIVFAVVGMKKNRGCRASS